MPRSKLLESPLPPADAELADGAQACFSPHVPPEPAPLSCGHSTQPYLEAMLSGQSQCEAERGKLV